MEERGDNYMETARYFGMRENDIGARSIIFTNLLFEDFSNIF